MRDYAKIAPTFWTGRTGRMLRGRSEAQIVAMYLMSSPHANMIGVFYCPPAYIAHDTGLSLERASKGLQSLVEAGFCTFEAELELIWVHEMARFQIGEALKSGDNRVVGARNEYERIPQGQIRRGFYEHYRHAFNLAEEQFDTSFYEASCKPLRSQKQEQKQEIEQKQKKERDVRSVSSKPLPAVRSPEARDDLPPAAHSLPKPSELSPAVHSPPVARSALSQGKRLPADWTLPKAWGEWALAEQSGWTREQVRGVAERFRDHWLAKAGRDACKADWLATWRNWVRRESLYAGHSPPKHASGNTLSEQNRQATERAKMLLFGAQTIPSNEGESIHEAC